MNERIKLLAYEAEDYADSIVDQGGEFHLAYTEKFAELIVRECGVVAYKTYCQTPGALGIQYKQAIEQHFGVEE